jgi:RHS repeat-associated protein
VAINRYDTATFTGGTVYLGKDALGSVRGATNDYGLLEERYEYDAFGKLYKGDLNSGMNLGYTGKPYDTATGLYNYGYRDYQPEVARFTTVDPIRDGANWFAYVNNDPVNYVDPWGLESTTIFFYGETRTLTMGGIPVLVSEYTYYSTSKENLTDDREGRIDHIEESNKKEAIPYTQSEDNPGVFTRTVKGSPIATETLVFSEIDKKEFIDGPPANLPIPPNGGVNSKQGNPKSNGLNCSGN